MPTASAPRAMALTMSVPRQMPPSTMTEGVVDIVSQMAKESGKPVVVCTIGGAYTKKTKEQFELKNIPVYPSPERAVKAMNILVERGKMYGC